MAGAAFGGGSVSSPWHAGLASVTISETLNGSNGAGFDNIVVALDGGGVPMPEPTATALLLLAAGALLCSRKRGT